MLALKDRRDQMILTMAIDAAHTKSKFCEARHKVARQVGYRRVRYQRFKSRRGDAMEEEVREVLRERRKKSIRFMGEWLEAQFARTPNKGLLVSTQTARTTYLSVCS